MGWPELLDELDRNLDAHEAAIDAGRPGPPEVVVPADIGRPPPDLVPRVQAQLERAIRLQRRIVDAQAAVIRAFTTATPTYSEEAPVYLDTRA